MISRRVFVAKCATVLSVPFVLFAFSGGPEPRKTGAPGDTTCNQAQCHVGTPLNASGNRVSLSFSGGTTYVPGEKQRITITISDTDARRAYGFQLTARLASNESNGQAGRFTAVEPQTVVICNNGDERDRAPRNGTCSAGQEVEFIEHSAPKSTGEFTVEWTPPTTNVGDIRFYVAGNAANGNGNEMGDRIYTANATLTPAAAGGPKPTISSGGVVNAGSGKAEITSKGWASLFGTDLTTGITVVSGSDIVDGRFPTSLGGVRVEVNGKQAFISFASPTQVNFQVADDDAQGNVNVEAINTGGRSNGMAVVKQSLSPAFLPFVDGDGKRYIAARHADFSVLGKPNLFSGLATTPARPGEVILLFGVGFGPTNPAVEAGRIANNIASTTSPVTVRVGETTAEVSYAGLSPGSSSLYQLNVKIPDSAAAGDLPVTAEINGVRTQDNIFITVQR